MHRRRGSRHGSNMQAWSSRPARASPPWLAALAALVLLAGCSGMGDLRSGFVDRCAAAALADVGAGKVKVGLILPLSATGDAAVAAQSMRNAAEMALAEFNNPDLQLLVKDDGGTAQGAQPVAQQVLDEGAEVHPRPLFALGGRVRSAGSPAPATFWWMAASSDCQRGSRVQRLSTSSFLPEISVERIIGYAARPGPPLVRHAHSRQCLWRRRRGRLRAGGRAPRRDAIVAGALSRGPAKMQAPVRTVAQAAAGGEPRGCDLHSGRRRVRRPRRRADADRRTASIPRTRCSSWAPACGRMRSIFSRSSALDGAWYAGPGLRPALADHATAAATGRTPCARPRSPTTRSRWSRRWSKPQGQQRSRRAVLTHGLRLHRHR